MAATQERDAESLALMEERTAMQWRAWRSYLTDKGVLLAAHQTDAAPQGGAAEAAFVRDADATRQRIDDAEARLQRLTPAQRTLFDDCVREERDQIRVELEDAHHAKGGSGHLLIDPDALELQALHELREACEGLHHPERLGDVPMPDDTNRWRQIDVTALNRTPNEQVYALAGSKDPRRANGSQIASYAAIGLLVLGLGWFYLGLGASATVPAAAADAEVLVDATPTPRWATTRASLTTAAGETTVALVLGTGTGWASAPEQTTLRDDQLYPMALCLPAAQLADLTSLTLHGDGQPDRRYTIRAEELAQPDLVLTACGNDPGPPRTGSLVETLPPIDLPIGSAATLADGSQVALLTVATQGDTSGQGQIQLLLTVQGLAGDLPPLQPTILLETGETVATPQRVTGADTTTADTAQISYALSAAEQPRAAVWSLTDPASGQIFRWRVTIAPAPSAAALLAQVLQISAVQAQRTSPTMIALTITLSNQGVTPISISATDFELTRSGSALPTPAFDRVALLPGSTPRRIIMSLPLAVGQELHIRIADQTFQIRD